VESDQLDSIFLSHSEKERLLMSRVSIVVRIAILFAITIWVLTLWNYNLPYATAITRAVFESLVTLALALFFWRIASAYIEKKIKEMTPEASETTDSEESEWGGGAQRGRSYTLLPMARKFIGTVLIVMVSMIILSAIGVNIGPLLAGAGVIGLAVGFGAQKLVSDVLSGFFYLLDDAFRVGEYVEAGGLSGAVEKITLRNVMLRHHRGMLQIVPYSDLGSITNFMRGGIVVKFNLEFSYDTNVDQVRKIIKKVGQEMLEEEEFKNDFIHPIKSQGVREIANSIMTIRVKFTAKPGAHFLIRREAYRRITEALMAKGIHYAHRKVIVELPEYTEIPKTDQKKYVEAGAAAGLAAMDEGGKSKES
jgi:small-conductance mechanosensitive channel